MSFIGVTKDKKSGLLLPFWRCGNCGSDRCYTDPKGKKRCWTCVPPYAVLAVMKKEKIERLRREQSAVEHFMDEDDDIQEFNFRHFGVRTS